MIETILLIGAGWVAVSFAVAFWLASILGRIKEQTVGPAQPIVGWPHEYLRSVPDVWRDDDRGVEFRVGDRVLVGATILAFGVVDGRAYAEIQTDDQHRDYLLLGELRPDLR